MLVEWEVVVPDKAGASRGHRSARIVPACEDGLVSAVSVPLAVGKRVAKALSQIPGRALDPEALAELVARETASCAREKVAALVNRRDYSERELAGKLLDGGFDKRTADSTVAWAAEIGLVDDQRFAASFARAKALSGWGRQKIERELERRGVSLDDGLDDDDGLLDEEAELERARALAARRARGERSDFPRIVRLLSSRGYSYDVCLRVAREVCERERVMD